MPRLPSDTTLRFVETIDDVMEMKRWLGERRDVMGLDTETSGLDPFAPGARLRLIQIGDHRTGWAVPWERWGGAALECMNAWRGQFTLHNASFDAKWLKKHAQWNMPWDRTHDTMIMAQIERPGQRNDLKYLSTQFVDPFSDAGAKDLKLAMKTHGWDWDTIPLDYPAYHQYSSLDPILAAHLWTHFRTDLKYPETYDLEMATRRVCTDMEYKGMRVDLEYSQQKFDELTQRVEDSKKWAKDNWKISIGSNPQLAEFFEKTLGAEFAKYSATSGNPSVDKEQMALFAQDSNPQVRAVAEFILGVRQAEKMSNSYFKNFLLMNNGGIVHPNIKTMGARTGRMSVTDPALQTLPSKDSLVRNAFIPYTDDELIVSSDYSQIELRLMAHFSNDKGLQSAFHDADRTGEDFFTNLGKQAYKDPGFKKSDHRRKLIKGFTYGLLYGAGVQKMADTAGVPFEEMRELAANVNETFPGIAKFMKDTEEIGDLREKEEGQGYIVTGTGRKIPSDKKKSYTLVNFTLQGNAAELMKKSIVRLDAAGFGPYMQMAIHDEMIFSLPRNMVEEATPEIAEIMSYNKGEFAVNLKAEPDEAVFRWGSKYDAK